MIVGTMGTNMLGERQYAQKGHTMKKAVKVQIEVKGTEIKGEAVWSFELTKSGAFQYGNGTAVSAEIVSEVNGERVEDTKYYDTRYWRGITTDEGFTEFCIETVKDFYGENAAAVKEVIA